jgi:hypothetical protein
MTKCRHMTTNRHCRLQRIRTIQNISVVSEVGGSLLGPAEFPTLAATLQLRGLRDRYV